LLKVCKSSASGVNYNGLIWYFAQFRGFEKNRQQGEPVPNYELKLANRRYFGPALKRLG
jgi:hypothetical protein